MKTAFAFFVLSLTTLSLAQGPARFTLVTASANNGIHNKEVVASGQQLWINRTTTSYCPAQVGAACPAGTITSFAGGQGTLGMNVMVPGGQQVYVNATGSIKFTQAHSAGMDPNSTTISFEYHPNIAGGYGQLTLTGRHGFLACPR